MAHGRYLPPASGSRQAVDDSLSEIPSSYTLQDVRQKIKHDFLSTYLAELAIWPAFQAINFWKVPVRHQLLVVNTGCLLDATFLCW